MYYMAEVLSTAERVFLRSKGTSFPQVLSFRSPGEALERKSEAIQVVMERSEV